MDGISLKWESLIFTAFFTYSIRHIIINFTIERCLHVISIQQNLYIYFHSIYIGFKGDRCIQYNNFIHTFLFQRVTLELISSNLKY